MLVCWWLQPFHFHVIRPPRFLLHIPLQGGLPGIAKADATRSSPLRKAYLGSQVARRQDPAGLVQRVTVSVERNDTTTERAPLIPEFYLLGDEWQL